MYKKHEKITSLVSKYMCEILDSDGCYYWKYSVVGRDAAWSDR